MKTVENRNVALIVCRFWRLCVALLVSGLLTLVSRGDPIKWAANGGGVWDATSGNWRNSGGQPTTYSDGAQVVFDETYVNQDTTVTLNTSVSPASVSVNNPSRTYTFSGSGGIAGGMSLTKDGAGTLNLGSVNTFTGNITINGGTVSVTENGRLYHSSPDNDTAVITINSAGTLELDSWWKDDQCSLGFLAEGGKHIVVNGGTIRVKGITGYGRGMFVNGSATFEAAADANWMLHTFTDSAPVSFNGNPTLILTGAGTGHFWKQVPGLGSVIKRGTGLWSLLLEDGSGNVGGYSGNTIVEQGVLRIMRAVLADNSTVVINRGGILDLWHGDTDVVGALVLNGVNMPPGVYSRSTHPEYFLGPGKLSVGGEAAEGDYTLTCWYKNYDNWPSSKQWWIKHSMTACLDYYNRYGTLGRLSGNVQINYNSGVPTAESSLGGPITFGQSVGVATAFHEMSHVQGTGTDGQYDGMFSGGVWGRPNAANLIEQIDGPGTKIHQSGIHFWPYNFNYDTENTDKAQKVAPCIIAAMKRDMGIGDQPPTISAIADQSIPGNTSAGPIAFTISSDGTALTATSSDTTLVPVNQIVFGGSGTSRTVTVTPASNRGGQAVIMVYVLDGKFATARAFNLTVTYTGAGPYYWDGNGTADGFGAASGTWGADNSWTTSSAGTATPANTTITTAGTVNFGTAAKGLGAGTITGPSTAQGFGSMNFGSASGGIIISGGALNLASPSVIAVNTASGATIGSVLQNGALTLSAGTLNLSGVNTYSGDTTISAGTLRIGSSGKLGGGSYAGPIINNGAFIYASSGLQLLSGQISGTGSMTISGAGALELSGANTYGGGTFISAGTLRSWSPGATGSGTVNVAPGATWDLLADSSTIAGLSGGGLVTSGGARTGADGAALISPSKNYVLKLDFGNGGGATVNGVTFDSVETSGAGWSLTGTGFTYNESGSPTDYNQLLSDFRYAGDSPTLTFSNLTVGKFYEAVLYTQAGIWGTRFVNAMFTCGGASQQLLNVDEGSVGYFAFRFLATAATASITMNAVVSGTTFHWFAASLADLGPTPKTLMVGNTDPCAFAGVIGGLLTVTKQGAGALTLSGANTYSGNTLVSAGTLALAGAGSIANSPVIVVASGATLDTMARSGGFILGATQTLQGNGKVAGNVTANGTLLSGGSFGGVTFSNDLAIAGEVRVELNTLTWSSNDCMVVVGSLTGIGTGRITVNLIGPALVAGRSFRVFSKPVASGAAMTITPAPGPGLVWSNMLAVDGSIAVITEPGLTSRTLVPAGAIWRYQDNGANLGSAWRNITFDDSAWKRGPAQLGYGDGDEATVVNYGPDATNKYFTTYFRRTFTLANASMINHLTASLLYDDGAVVYLNGTEVWRSNMPTNGVVTYLTPALSAVADENAWLTTNLNTALLVDGTNVIAVEIHQSSRTSSDISFDFALNGTSLGSFLNQPPDLFLTKPDDGQEFVAPANVTITAYAQDPDGSVARVEFFAGAIKVGEQTVPPFSLTLTNLPVGDFVLSATATDTNGVTVASANTPAIRILPPPVTTLISPGTFWRYLDDGSDQGTAWHTMDFNDAGWKVGPAQLGYGDGDEATVVSYGPNPTNKYITTWFRRSFFLDNASIITGLTANLLCDDGAVVYLNGTEVWRYNMPTNGLIGYTTLASTAIGGAAETNWLTTNLSAAPLVDGMNVVAVEIHQDATNSSDISFDFALTATSLDLLPNQQPEVLLTQPADGQLLSAPANITVNAVAKDPDGAVAKVDFYLGNILVGEQLTAPYSLTLSNLPIGDYVLSAIATDDRNATAVSLNSPVIRVRPAITASLISTGAVWKYLDNGANLGTAWRANTFNDSAWKSSPAQLGYGDGDEATVVGYGPDSNNKYLTTYFRHSFVLFNTNSITSLSARLLRDDGAAVYLNGLEVWRSNMPTNTINYLTLAVTNVGGADETNHFYTNDLSPSLLLAGTNVVAVEIHQAATNSSDLSFDFELTATALLAGMPALRIANSPGSLMLSAPSDASYFTVHSATNLASPVAWTPLTNTPVLTSNEWRVTLPAATNGQRFFRLQHHEFYEETNSAARRHRLAVLRRGGDLDHARSRRQRLEVSRQRRKPRHGVADEHLQRCRLGQRASAARLRRDERGRVAAHH